jgi:hypothetical protein
MTAVAILLHPDVRAPEWPAERSISLLQDSLQALSPSVSPPHVRWSGHSDWVSAPVPSSPQELMLPAGRLPALDSEPMLQRSVLASLRRVPSADVDAVTARGWPSPDPSLVTGWPKALAASVLTIRQIDSSSGYALSLPKAYKGSVNAQPLTKRSGSDLPGVFTYLDLSAEDGGCAGGLHEAHGWSGVGFLVPSSTEGVGRVDLTKGLADRVPDPLWSDLSKRVPVECMSLINPIYDGEKSGKHTYRSPLAQAAIRCRATRLRDALGSGRAFDTVLAHDRPFQRIPPSSGHQGNRRRPTEEQRWLPILIDQGRLAVGIVSEGGTLAMEVGGFSEPSTLEALHILGLFFDRWIMVWPRSVSPIFREESHAAGSMWVVFSGRRVSRTIEHVEAGILQALHRLKPGRADSQVGGACRVPERVLSWWRDSHSRWIKDISRAWESVASSLNSSASTVAAEADTSTWSGSPHVVKAELGLLKAQSLWTESVSPPSPPSQPAAPPGYRWRQTGLDLYRAWLQWRRGDAVVLMPRDTAPTEGLGEQTSVTELELVAPVTGTHCMLFGSEGQTWCNDGTDAWEAVHTGPKVPEGVWIEAVWDGCVAWAVGVWAVPEDPYLFTRHPSVRYAMVEPWAKAMSAGGWLVIPRAEGHVAVPRRHLTVQREGCSYRMLWLAL